MREAHKDLEWFGPPEHNTLHLLCDVLPDLVCKLGEEQCVSLCKTKTSYLTCMLSLLYIQGEHVQSVGTRRVDPAIYDKIRYTLALNASDLEIFRVGLHAHLPTRHGPELSCWCRV